MPATSPTRRPCLPLLASLLSVLLLVPAARGQGAIWPRQFDSSSGTFIVYQPQPEQLSRTMVTARAAFSLQKVGASAPTFGVLWFQAHVQIDRDSLTVNETDLDVTKVRLPGATAAEAKRYELLVEAEATGWDLSGSLEELKAGLSASAKERLSVEDLDHTPPRILFRTRPTLLVSYDGEPQIEPIEGSSLQRVSNTPFAVIFDPALSAYYLNGANLWYRARDPLGPWSVVDAPPAEIAAAVPPDTSASDQVTGPAPDVMTATEPTELIVTDGDPLLSALVGSELFYVTNTESDVLRDAKTRAIYVLLSGRWFSAPDQNGPWTYVAADQLPGVFAQIPADSPKGNLLASVAGTDQADDAVADDQIPQTSAVARDDHDASVTWDGPPQFENADGSSLRYGVNTDAEVVSAGGRYYLCDQGVWYVADDPNGPWSVSDVRPIGLDDLQPSCPVYNLRYVEIYDVTPDYVEVGYLPGYLGYYPCRGAVVYGTGYRYRAWRSRHHFYPRPCTWGFHARYNPWIGRWSFGFSYWSGFLHVGLRWQPGHPESGPGRPRRMAPWLGPGGYHRPLLANDHSMVRVHPVRSHARVGELTPVNLYTRSDNVRRFVKPAARTPNPRVIGAARQAPLPDNVYAGSDGHVYQRATDGSWRVNQGRKWLPTPVPVTPSPPVVPIGGGGDNSGGGSRMRGDAQRPHVMPSPQPAQPNTGTSSPMPVNPPVERVPAQPQPAQQAPTQHEWRIVTPQQPPVPNQPSRPYTPTPIVRQPVQPLPGLAPGGLERDFRARERTSNPAPAQAPAPQRVKPVQQQEKKDNGPRRGK